MNLPSNGEIEQAVVDGDAAAARRMAEALVAGGADLLAAVEEGFGRGIRRVGDLWEEGEYFLPELVQGAEAMKAAMAVVQPALAAGRGAGRSKGRVVIGTIQGDLHDIGKSLVGTLLAANGFEVFDLGSDVAVEAFVAKAREVEAGIVAASALLTTTMIAQRDLVAALAAADLPSRPRVLVGGAPTSPAWAEQIGAAHAENAMRAVAAAERLIHA
jgi:trimethylamine corrinoid protein